MDRLALRCTTLLLTAVFLVSGGRSAYAHIHAHPVRFTDPFKYPNTIAVRPSLLAKRQSSRSKRDAIGKIE